MDLLKIVLLICILCVACMSCMPAKGSTAETRSKLEADIRAVDSKLKSLTRKKTQQPSNEDYLAGTEDTIRRKLQELLKKTWANLNYNLNEYR